MKYRLYGCRIRPFPRCLAVGDGAAGYSELDFRLHHGVLPLGRLALALEPAFILGLVLITFCLWLFPDERLPSGRWRPVAWSLAAAGLAYGLVVFVPWVIAALSPQVRLDASGTPVAVTHGIAGLIWGASLIGVLGLILSWVTWLAVQVPRYQHSAGERRQQLKWLYSGAFVSVVSLVVTIASRVRPPPPRGSPPRWAPPGCPRCRSRSASAF